MKHRHSSAASSALRGGAKATAARTLQSKSDREVAIDSLVRYHVSAASMQGFLTSVGGLITLPVGLPANIPGMAVPGVRIVASIAPPPGLIEGPG